MSTIDNLKANIQSTSIGQQRRKIQHEIYGMDGAILEDTGRNLFTYSLEVICTGPTWENDRDELEKVLDKNGSFVVNQEDLGIINVELLSYSIDESRFKTGLSTFYIELIESLDNIETITKSLDSNLGVLDKLKDAYKTYETTMATVSRYRGRLLAITTTVTGFINEILNLPDTLLSNNKSFFNALIDQISSVNIDDLLRLQDMDFIPVIPNDPVEYEQTKEFSELIKSVMFFKTIDQISKSEPFETLEQHLIFNKKLSKQYNSRLNATSEALNDHLTDVYASYLDSFNNQSINLKSIYKFKTEKSLLIALFEESPTTEFDSLFTIQSLKIEDLFGIDFNQKEYIYLK